MLWLAPVGSPDAGLTAQTHVHPADVALPYEVSACGHAAADGEGASAWSWHAMEKWMPPQFEDGFIWHASNEAPPQFPMVSSPSNSSSSTHESWHQFPNELLVPSLSDHSSAFAETVPEDPERLDMMHDGHAAGRSSESDAAKLRRRRCNAQPPSPSGTAPERWAYYDEQEAAADETHRDAVLARESSQELLSQFQAGGQARKAALDSFKRMAFAGKASSLAAQRALKESSANDAAMLAAGLHGHVRSAVQSKYANYVVQEIMAVVPVARARFVAEELVGFGGEAARHRIACRAVCRILEHESPGDGAVAQLVDEILADVSELCSHTFGSFVIRHILEFGLPGHRQRIASALCSDVMSNAKHKHGSHVVEAALRFCEPQDQRAIVGHLLARKDQLLALASHQFGRHVVKALVCAPQLPPDLQATTQGSLRSLSRQLQASRYGKSVLHSLKVASD